MLRIRTKYRMRGCRPAAFFLMVPVAMVSSACGDGGLLGPEELPGEYSAVRADGNPVPTFINADGSQESGLRLLDGTMNIGESQSLTIVLDQEIQGNQLPPDTLYADYYVDGSVLHFQETAGRPLRIARRGIILEDGSIVILVYYQAQALAGFTVRLVELVFAN